METSPNPDKNRRSTHGNLLPGYETVYEPSGFKDNEGIEILIPVQNRVVTLPAEDRTEQPEIPLAMAAAQPEMSTTEAPVIAQLETVLGETSTRAESAQRLSSLAARLDRMANRVESGRQHYESTKERAVNSARRLGSFANSLALASREKYHNLAPTRLRRVGRLATAAAGGLRDNIAEAHADNLGISASLNSINADQIRRGAQLDPTLNPEGLHLAIQRQEQLAEIKRARAAKTRNKIAARQYRRQIRQQRLMARAANRQPSRTNYTTGLRTAA